MKQVFISYPRDNATGQALARSLYSALQKEQISAFLDEESIEPGERWLKSLKEGVAGCKIMLSVISTASDDRKWFEKEFNEAQKHDILIIPVLSEDTDIPMQLTDLQAVPLYGEQAKDQQIRLFQSIRKTLGVDVINPLIKKAIQAKRNEAYDTAISLWSQVLEISPEQTRAHEEIGILKELNQTKQKGADLSERLAQRYMDIQPVFSDVISLLKQAAKRPDAALPLIEKTQLFLDNKLTAEEYINSSRVICQPMTNLSQTVQSPDYAALAERISKGEVALFLGSDIAQEYGDKAKSEQQLATELAQQAKYENFGGSLSSIAEYLRLGVEVGSSGLWSKLESAIAHEQVDTALYPLLARIDAPLILISSAYDDSLERCFQASGKPYVELSSIVCRTDEYDIGHVIASYSDHSVKDRPYLNEQLSTLKLYEQGYSIIYKIRGSCTSGSNNELKRDALTVAESDYFTFARHAEEIIPSYLTGLLRGRGFLFIGLNPDSWEQRLLVNALLSKRTHASDDCYTVGVSRDLLEAAYWKKQRVHHYDVNLPELDEHIEEVLL